MAHFRHVRRRTSLLILGAVPLLMGLLFTGEAISRIELFKSQTVYVPAYSHIYHGDRESPLYLAVTLSIRNTDPSHPLSITSVDYFDTEGKPVKRYLEKELRLAPLGSAHYLVKESDKSGGSGASFIVKWKAEERVTAPIVEAIMISTASQQGVSFTSRGQAIAEE